MICMQMYLGKSILIFAISLECIKKNKGGVSDVMDR